MGRVTVFKQSTWRFQGSLNGEWVSMYSNHDVPLEYLKKWQKTLDVAAQVMDVPAALVMRVWPEQIEVLVSSVGDDNPYEEHEKADLGTGLYCETVMSTRQQLMVPNALEDADWKDNPDVKLNMINYLGVPLVWPDNTIFGTMCVLDSKTRHYTAAYQELLWQLKDLIESDFRAIVEAGGDEAQKATRVRHLEEEINALLVRLGQVPKYPEDGA
jgi:transcriptional regulator with GAF, ATPase, and Fis domain